MDQETEKTLVLANNLTTLSTVKCDKCGDKATEQQDSDEAAGTLLGRGWDIDLETEHVTCPKCSDDE